MFLTLGSTEAVLPEGEPIYFLTGAPVPYEASATEGWYEFFTRPKNTLTVDFTGTR